VRVPDAVQRERAPRNKIEICAYALARASGAPLIRDRQDRVFGGPASAAQRGSASNLNRKCFGRAALRAGHRNRRLPIAGGYAACISSACRFNLATS
jgi:hypothetical protein